MIGDERAATSGASFLVERFFAPAAGVGPIALSIAPGEVLALIGPAGGGKSALLAALAGAIAGEGAVWVRGAALGAGPIARRRAAVLYAPKTPPGGQALTVREHVALGAGRGMRLDPNRYWPGPTPPPQGRALMATLDVRARRMADIARVLAAAPEVALLDSPAVDLGPRGVAAALERLRALGAATLLAEDYAPAALRLADRAMFLEGGAIRAEGTAAELAEDPAILRACMGEARF